MLLCLLLALCLIYQAYRYPFQINSAVTSPTYRDTPTWLQFGKWGLIAVIAAGIALLLATNARRVIADALRIHGLALLLEAAIVVLASIRLALGAASVDPWLMLIGAGIAGLVTLSAGATLTASRWMIRVLVVYSFVAVIAELIQVALFLAVGRLPALAYAHSPSIRFGSLLDDPNGFAVLLAALLPTTWVALRSSPNLRIVISVALLCCLPLTQSWTGITATVVALALTWGLTRGLKRDVRRAAGAAAALAVIAGVAAFFARSTIAELILLKRGSAENHAASFSHVVPEAPSTAAVPQAAAPAAAPPVAHVARATWTSGLESSYVNILVNYGPLLLLAYLALGLIAIVLLLRGTSRLPLALRVGGAAYLVSFMLASANLGLDRTFPCNVLFFFFCGAAFASSTTRAPAKATTMSLLRSAAGFRRLRRENDGSRTNGHKPSSEMA